MEKTALDYYAHTITTCLMNLGVPVAVVATRQGPQFTQFLLRPAPSVRVNSIIQRTNDLARALGSSLVRVSLSGTHVAIDVPTYESRTIALSKLLPRVTQPYAALLGIDPQARAVQIRLDLPITPHVLVSGMTGSGKTELVKTMLVSLARKHRPHQLSFVVIDPKKREDPQLAGLLADHLIRPIADDITSALLTLRELVNQVDLRRVGDPNNTRIVVYVDELTDLCAQGGQEFTQLLTRIVQRGREANIHIIACTQKPTSRAVDPVMKANFPARIVMRVASAEDSRVATGLPQVGGEHLIGNGDAIICVGGATLRFQAALCDLKPTVRLPASVPVAPVVPASEAVVDATAAAPLPPVASAPRALYTPADPADPLQVAVANALNANPALSSLRALQAATMTPSGKRYSGGQHYWPFVQAAAAVHFAPAVASWKLHSDSLKPADTPEPSQNP